MSYIGRIFAEQLQITVTREERAFGGSINDCFVVTADSGERYFAKTQDEAEADFFEHEEIGLREIAATNTVRVPHVIYRSSSTAETPALLVLEYLESKGKRSERDDEKLAAQLAAMHRPAKDRFGFSRNNVIGLTPQINDWKDSWSEFFLRNRLMKQAEFGVQQGWFKLEFEKLLRSKGPALCRVLEAGPHQASLLHGDLWTGNVHYSTDGPALIDPAVYYGDREADIAATELFGSLSPRFYDAYNEAWPLEPGYPERKRIYNLYHLMNHANMFGGSYVQAVWDSLNKIQS